MSVNKVIMIGNVCQDPKVTTFESGNKVAQFDIATNKPARKKEDGTEIPESTEYHHIVANFTKLAERVEKYVRKGKKLYIEGELRNRAYERDGIKQYITEIYIYELEMLTPKSAGDNTPPPPNPNDERPF